MFCFFGGGLGGNPETDGLNHGNNPISTATIPPLEILEAAYPVAFRQWALRPDSGGPGLHRGGCGAVYEIGLREGITAEAFLLGERGRFPPFGTNGGGAAAPNRFTHGTEDERHAPPMTSKAFGIALSSGMTVRLETPGGGGWGDPRARDTAAVARDVRCGYVTPQAALRDYAAVIGDDGTVDAAATARLRGGAA
jgi:N-methylhydantoinase B